MDGLLFVIERDFLIVEHFETRPTPITPSDTRYSNPITCSDTEICSDSRYWSRLKGHDLSP
ncbi:hypothetical protein ACLOJK_027557 [Asimina triloba]